MRTGRLVSIFSALGLLAALAGGAHASTGGPTSVAVSGALGRSIGTIDPGDFGAVTLNGEDRAIYASLDSFQVTDATGTGAGWKVTFQASPFACTTGSGQCPTGGDTLATGSLQIAKPTVACANGNSCLNRSAVPSGGITAATAIDGAAAVTVLSAAAGSGMGKYVVTPGAFVETDATTNLRLQLPAYAYAATYTSTLTIDISNGP